MPAHYGVMTRPHDRGIAQGVKEGRMCAVESEGFSVYGFTPDLYFRHLRKLQPYKSQVLFVVVPDRVGDAKGTYKLWQKWALRIKKFGYPLAYCVQNGQEDLPLPFDPSPDWLFIAGNEGWKGSKHALECLRRGVALGMKIHVGRVNGRGRIGYWRAYGADSMDGTSAIHHPTQARHTIDQGYNNVVIQLADSLVYKIALLDLGQFSDIYELDCIVDPDGMIDQGMYMHLLYGGQT